MSAPSAFQPLSGDRGIPLLYASCVPVLGTSRALIVDLEKRRALPIPLKWGEMLITHRGSSMEQLKALACAGEERALETFFTLLVERQLAFLTSTPERFPLLELRLERPHPLSHAILDRDATSTWDLEAVLEQLDALGCEHALFRLSGPEPLGLLEDALAALGRRRPTTVSAWLEHQSGITAEAVEARCEANARLQSVIVFGAPGQREVRRARSGVGNVLFLQRPFRPELPPLPRPERLIIGRELFAEAHHANPFFTGKIAVTASGVLQPSPFAGPALGRVETTPIAAALQHPTRLALTRVGKDQIEPCRRCEYRYSCLDPLPPRPLPGGRWERPELCDYDPATGTWATGKPHPTPHTGQAS